VARQDEPRDYVITAEKGYQKVRGSDAALKYYL
jgi:hypothetical protein